MADKARLMAEADYWQEATASLFWKQILDQREALLSDIARHLTGRDVQGPSPVPSLAAAKRRLADLSPADFVSFIEEWLASLAVWRSRLPHPSGGVSLDTARAIEKAIAKLGLVHVVRSHELSPQRDATTGVGWVGGFADRCNRWMADSRRRFGAKSEL